MATSLLKTYSQKDHEDKTIFLHQPIFEMTTHKRHNTQRNSFTVSVCICCANTMLYCEKIQEERSAKPKKKAFIFIVREMSHKYGHWMHSEEFVDSDLLALLTFWFLHSQPMSIDCVRERSANFLSWFASQFQAHFVFFFFSDEIAQSVNNPTSKWKFPSKFSTWQLVVLLCECQTIHIRLCFGIFGSKRQCY